MNGRIVPAILSLSVAIAFLAGCGGGGTKTYTVKGKVVVKNGDVKKLVGGHVRFESIADAKVKGVGEIEEDGQFVVAAFVDDKPVAGIPEGEYRARVDPPRDEDADPGTRVAVKKGQLQPKYKDFERSGLTYTVKPGDNTFNVEVELVP